MAGDRQLRVTIVGSSRDAQAAFRDLDDSSGRFEGALGRIGNLAAVAGAAIATAVGAAAAATVASTVTMENALVPIGTIVGQDSQQFQDLSAAVVDVIRNSPANANDVGMAAYTTLSAGITDTAEVTETLTAAQQLAAAGLGEMGSATDLITSAMNSFTGENLSATQAAEILFGTISSGKTTTDQLAQGFGSIAPLAGSIGIRFEELAATTAALTATGMPASQAYAALRGVISNIARPTVDAARAAEELGIEFSLAHMQNVGFPAFIQEIGAAAGDDQQAMIDMFGSMEAVGAVMALTGPQADALAANLTGVADAGANLQERAAEVNNTLSNQFAEMKNRVMIYLSEIGQHVMEWLQPRLAALQQWVTDHWPQIQAVVQQVWEGIQNAWNTVLKPVLETIVQAATAVVQWIVDHWPEIQAIMQAAWEAIQAIWQAVGKPIFDALKQILGEVIDFVNRNWPQISATIEAVFQTVKFIFENIVAPIMTAILTVVGEVISFIFDNAHLISDGLESAWNAAKWAWEHIGKPVWDAIKSAVDTVKGAIEGIVGAVSRAMDAISHIGGILNPFDSGPAASVGGSLPRAAGGGTFASGDWAWVGEAGAELVSFGSNGGRVFPHDQSVAMANGVRIEHFHAGDMSPGQMAQALAYEMRLVA